MRSLIDQARADLRFERERFRYVPLRNIGNSLLQRVDIVGDEEVLVRQHRLPTGERNARQQIITARACRHTHCVMLSIIGVAARERFVRERILDVRRRCDPIERAIHRDSERMRQTAGIQRDGRKLHERKREERACNYRSDERAARI